MHESPVASDNVFLNPHQHVARMLFKSRQHMCIDGVCSFFLKCVVCTVTIHSSATVNGSIRSYKS